MSNLTVSRSALGALLGTVLAALLAGCAAATGGSPTPGASADHPAGATAVILRYDQQGGFISPSFLATQGPIFSLYGDGTAIFRNPATSPPPAARNVSPGVPYEMAKLTEPQIEALVGFALKDGALATASDHYDRPIADAPTAVFSVNAGGVKKTVSVNGLGVDSGGNPDAAVFAGLSRLAARLAAYGDEIGNEQPWTPDRYRGILTEEAFDQPVLWPWPDIKPAEFVQGTGADDPQFPIRTMTLAEVAMLNLTGIEGGFQGLTLSGPDGKTYTFALRPLLPDEAH